MAEGGRGTQNPTAIVDVFQVLSYKREYKLKNLLLQLWNADEHRLCARVALVFGAVQICVVVLDAVCVLVFVSAAALRCVVVECCSLLIVLHAVDPVDE